MPLPISSRRSQHPRQRKVPELHRYIAGGTFGGPIKKNKLFGYVGYQHLHDSDQEIGTLPHGRSFRTQQHESHGRRPRRDRQRRISAIRIAVFGTASRHQPDRSGSDAIQTAQRPIHDPESTTATTPTINFPENAIVPSAAYFIADQAVSNLDYIVNSKDTLALKYYYQHDPTSAPFAYSSVAGFTQHLDAGSQVATITNTQTLTPNLSVAEIFGFIREKIYSTIDQPFTPQQLGINTFGSTTFPGISIIDILGNSSPNNVNNVANAGMNIGMGSEAQSAFTGIFQNRFMPSANATWTKGRHTITFGGAFAYTQLNARDERTGQGHDRLCRFFPVPSGTGHSYYRGRILSPPPSCKATPTATIAPIKPANTFRINSNSNPI